MGDIYYDLMAEVKFDPRDPVVYKIPFKEIKENGLISTVAFLFDHLEGIRSINILKNGKEVNYNGR